MKKKNFLLIIIILVAALLIGLVIWIYAKRIENIENKMKKSTGSNINDTYIIDSVKKSYASKSENLFFKIDEKLNSKLISALCRNHKNYLQ